MNRAVTETLLLKGIQLPYEKYQQRYCGNVD